MFIFYIVGGVIGVLIHLRFVIPLTYYDMKMAWGFWGGVKTFFYHLIRGSLLGCVVFFASWISVGYFIFCYSDLKNELESKK